jgi:hypothetical protein
MPRMRMPRKHIPRKHMHRMHVHRTLRPPSTMYRLGKTFVSEDWAPCFGALHLPVP